MSPAGPPRESFWRRRVVAPVLAQLHQGITPERIALTVALGAVLAVFPVLGSTTLLCGLAAVLLRLNQPVIQLVNYLCYPLQFALLLPFLRAGEWFGAPPLQESVPQLIAQFRATPLRFMADYGRIALGGIAAWCVVAPFAALLIYGVLRPVLGRAADRLAQSPTRGR